MLLHDQTPPVPCTAQSGELSSTVRISSTGGDNNITGLNSPTCVAFRYWRHTVLRLAWSDMSPEETSIASTEWAKGRKAESASMALSSAFTTAQFIDD